MQIGPEALPIRRNHAGFKRRRSGNGFVEEVAAPHGNASMCASTRVETWLMPATPSTAIVNHPCPSSSVCMSMSMPASRRVRGESREVRDGEARLRPIGEDHVLRRIQRLLDRPTQIQRRRCATVPCTCYRRLGRPFRDWPAPGRRRCAHPHPGHPDHRRPTESSRGNGLERLPVGVFADSWPMA